MRLHNITHSKPHVEKKVRYFADYYSFLLRFVDFPEVFLIETPLSIFENIQIQIESNLEKCTPYFEKHFNHPLVRNYGFTTASRLIKQFYGLIEDYEEMENLKNLDANKIRKKKLQWLKRKKIDLLNLTSKIISRMNRELFKEYVGKISICLQCNCELEVQQKRIESLSNLIVSDFLLNGFTIGDIGRIFDFIMSKDPKKFPFKRSLFFGKGKEESSQAIQKFFQNRTFNDQFLGIDNFRFKKKITSYFLFKIEGVYLKELDSFKIGETEIISSNSKRFKNLKEAKLKMSNVHKTFFDKPENFVIALIKSTYRSESFARNEVLTELNRVVMELNTQTNSTYNLNSNDVIVTTDFKDFNGRVSLFKKKRVKNLSKWDIRKIESENFNVVEGKSHLFQKLREVENVFKSAIIQNSLDEYWRYLESLGNKIMSNCSPEKISKTFAFLLLPYYKNRFAVNHKDYLHDLVMNQTTFVGFQHNDYNRFRMAENFTLNELESTAKNDLLLELIKRINIEKEKPKLNDEYNLYSGLLNDLYEYRNHFIHTGLIHQNLKIKLELIIPRLVKQFRYILEDLINTSKRDELNSIVQSGASAGAKLI